MNDHSLLMKMPQMKNKSKILNFLLRNLDPHNINQIARILGISLGSVHKILKELEDLKLVKNKEIGNALYYNINFDNIEAIKYLEVILIEDKNHVVNRNRTAKVYVSDIESYNAKCIVLFGSILMSGEQAKDVDALFIIRSKEQIKEVYNFCLQISKIRTKKVNPIIMLEQDFINNIKNRNKAVLDIIKRGIILKGGEIFVRSIKNAL